MDLGAGVGLLGILLLVAANGFFVATEFAIVAVRRSKLAELAAGGHANARAAEDVVGHLDTYIAACQLGITMASLALGWIGEPVFSQLIDPPLAALVGPISEEVVRGASAVASFALITMLHIVLGELAPKGLALQRTEATTLWVARPIRIFETVFRWPIALLNGIGNGVLRLAGLAPSTGHERVHSVEELRLLVTGMQQAGVVEASEARIADRAFRFADLSAGELMTPRTEVEAVPATSPLPQLLERARTSTHSRWLVYEGSLDNIIGVLHVRRLFAMLGSNPDSFDLRTLLQPVLVEPQSKPADDLLDEMRASRQQLALLVDEYGGTAGIVTLQDLLGALVGRIQPEQPFESNAPDGPRPSHAPDGPLLLDGMTRLPEFEELTGIRVDQRSREAVDTLGGLVMLQLGRVPAVGEEVSMGNFLLRVEALDGRRVATVRFLASTEPGRPTPIVDSVPQHH
jgi:CBS domain containing-hemolysin-like protein